MTTMRAAVLEQPRRIVVKDVSVPEPGADEALIRIMCAGVCGSDVHYYEHGKIGRYVVEQPLILGHEVAGIVTAVGSDVRDLREGDRVAIEPGVACGRCRYCKGGAYNLCPEVVFMATPPVDGAWSQYAVVRADFLHKLPDSLSFEEGALLEPLSVGFHAMRRANVKPDDRVLITGLGPIGQLAVVAARLFGVTEVYGSDVVPYRRGLALDMGVTAVCDPLAESLRDKIYGWTGGEGADVVIETSGNAAVISSLTGLVRRGGKIVLVGLPAADAIPVNINEIIDGELDVKGVFRYANTYEAVIRALQAGNVSLERTITHQYELENIQEALDTSIHQRSASMKIMIYPNGK